MPKTDVLIVGGGTVGLCIAYNLTRKGVSVKVLEKSYMNAGSTGRNLGILKERIPHENKESRKALITLARLGVKMHAGLSSETGINTFYRKSGCLNYAKTEEELALLDEEHILHKELGLKDQKLTPAQIESKWKYIKTDEILGAYYSPDEAMAHPFGMTWAFMENLNKRGNIVEKMNPVTAIEEKNGEYKVTAKNGEYTADKVLVASGAISGEIVEPLGYNVNLIPVRKEMIISEPMRPFLGPTIDRPSKRYWIAQTMRGEILGTIGELPPSFDISEVTIKFLNDFANETLSVLPTLKDLRTIRQWTGIVERTEDSMPIIGELNKDLYIACGFENYGITMALAVGKLFAESIVKGAMEPRLMPFTPSRFS